MIDSVDAGEFLCLADAIKKRRNQISNKTLSVKHWLSCSLCYDNWKRWSIEKPNVKSDNWALIEFDQKISGLNNIEIVPRKKIISHINLSKFQVLFLQKLHQTSCLQCSSLLISCQQHHPWWRWWWSFSRCLVFTILPSPYVKNTGKHWKILENTEKYWRIQKNWKILKNTEKYWKRYWKMPYIKAKAQLNEPSSSSCCKYWKY